jgi:hypothetical protein
MKINNFLIILILLPFLLFSSSFFGQKIPFKKLQLSQISKEIKYKGKIKQAISWTDKLGKNLVITTETGIYTNPKSENNGGDAYVYGLHFLNNQLSKPNWKVNDFVQDCTLDYTCEFIENTLQVTDLNHNSIAEVWLMYKTGCRGDISPDLLKIIMYEGNKKYAMRGETLFIYKNEEGGQSSEGGKFTFDDTFLKSSQNIRDFALKLWTENNFK